MTSQIRDRFIYRDNEYIVVAISGNGLLSPQDFDVAHMPLSSACMRGYYSKYSCIDSKLTLITMTVALSESDKNKIINGIHPVGDLDWLIKDRYHAYRYDGLNIVIPFTGGFLIAKDRIKKSGPPEMPQLYKTVVELLFAEGHFKEAIDCSEIVERSREDVFQNGMDFSLPGKFSLKYDFMYNWDV